LRLGAIERTTTLRPSRDASYKIAFPVENASQLELVRPRTPAKTPFKYYTIFYKRKLYKSAKKFRKIISFFGGNTPKTG